MRAPNLERRARRRGIVGAAAALGPLLASLLAAGCGGGGGPADPCEPNPCVGLHKTSCLEVDGAARCMCEAGYVESATGDCVSAGGCDPNPCREEHRTRCESPDGAVVCLCDPGYVDGPGGACVPDPCLPNPCAEPNRTRCSAELGVAVCRCDAGWEEGPGGTCVPDDPCLPNPCAEAHRTRCVADGQAVSCLCDDGYVEGGQGECVRPCDLQPCQTPPRTRCANRGESAVCLCDEGMLETEQGVCVDDVCEPNPCAEPRRTACVRQGQTHVCACDPGYALQGAACQRAAANLCSAGGWCLENPLPSVDGLHGVWAHDAHNALAVGEAGRILHHDGTDCVALDAGTWLDVLAVDGRSLSDVWAVGQDGMVLHYDGERWLSVTPTVDPPIRSALRAVWAADAQHVHVAGDDGVWLFLDGESWSRFDTGISQGAIHNLGGSGPYDVWATSDFGRFLHYDGEAVQVHLLVENENLYGLFVEGPEALVVSTSNGRLVRWDGASFEFMTESAGMSGVLLTSVWGDGLGGYYTTGFDILGGRGTILRWDGHAWEEVWAESLGFVWDVDGWPGQAALAVGLGGLLVRDAPGEDAELLVQGTRKDLRAAAQRPDGALFACGLDRTLLRRDPEGWVPVADVPALSFYDLFFAADGTGHLAATLGHLMAWDGSTFRSLTDADGNGQADAAMERRTLRALWPLPGGEILVAGEDGLAGVWDGQAWVDRDLPGTRDDLFDVWGSAVDDVWVVGENLGVYHHDGNGWLPVEVPRPAALAENDSYSGVWGSAAGEVTVVGNLGTILRLSGGAWSVEPSGTTAHLRRIIGQPDGTRWAVGEGGTILRSDGAGGGWVRQESGTRAWLWSLAWFSDGAGLATGSGGALFYHAP